MWVFGVFDEDGEPLAWVGRDLKFADPRGTTIVALYALYGAVTDTPWTELSAEVKRQLRRAAGRPDRGTDEFSDLQG